MDYSYILPILLKSNKVTLTWHIGLLLIEKHFVNIKFWFITISKWVHKIQGSRWNKKSWELRKLSEICHDEILIPILSFLFHFHWECNLANPLINYRIDFFSSTLLCFLNFKCFCLLIVEENIQNNERWITYVNLFFIQWFNIVNGVSVFICMYISMHICTYIYSYMYFYS